MNHLYWRAAAAGLGLGALGALAACGPDSAGAGSLVGTQPPAGVASQSAAEGPAAPEPGVIVFPRESPRLKQLKVDTVRAASVQQDEIVAPGRVCVDSNRVSRVLLPLPGRVMRVIVKLGDAVRAGQPLLEIESPDADAAMAAHLQADSVVTQAKASLTKARADFERTTDLFEHKAVANKEVLNAENALTLAKAALDQAEAASAQAGRHLRILGLSPGEFGQLVVLRAPMSGKVLDVSVAPGEYRSDMNAPLMTIADLSTVWVASEVPESSIRMIEVGEQLQVELVAYPGEVFEGRVTRIADTVDPRTRTVQVQSELDNRQGRFRPEMFGRIRHSHEPRTLPVVPSGAVIQGDGTNFVFLEQGPGRFCKTSVSVGRAAGGQVPILTGIKPGDRIIVDGAVLLKDY